MVEFYTRPLAVVGISALSFSIWARHPTEWTVSRVQVAFAEKCWLYPTWTCLLAFTLSRGPGVCHSGASCSWRADDMVRSWKSTDQSENGLAGSDNWISGFQDSGSIPIRSFTAPRSRCLQPRYFSVVCTHHHKGPSGQTLGLQQRGNQNIGIEDDPNHCSEGRRSRRAFRAAAISASISSTES